MYLDIFSVLSMDPTESGNKYIVIIGKWECYGVVHCAMVCSPKLGGAMEAMGGYIMLGVATTTRAFS
jgi:hypothetical protein